MREALGKHWVNIGLLAVALGLLLAVLVTSGKVTTTEKEARENNVLMAYRSDELTRVVIERGSKRVAIERGVADDAGDSAWNISEPFKEEADPYAVDKLLGSLEFATALRRIKPEQVNRQAFGLDTPRMVIVLDMGKVSYRLLLGKEAASPPGAAYLEVTGDGAPGKGVVIVSKDLVKELSLDVGALRGQQIFPYLSTSLRELLLEGIGGARHLRRAEWGDWRFKAMRGDRRVNREALDRILLQCARTKAESFIDIAAAGKALSGAESVKITMLHEDPKRPRAVVEVGGKCPTAVGVVALRREPDPIAACVSDSVLPGLGTSLDELDDRTLFSRRKDEVEGLFISAGDKRLELERKGNGFALRAPVKADVDLEAGNRRIEAIVSTRGDLVTDRSKKELGLEPAAGQVRIKSVPQGEKVHEETLLVGAAASDGSVHVQRVQDGTLLKLGRDAARALVPDATLVRNRKVLTFEADQLTSIELKSRDQVQRLIRNPAGSYALELPKGFQHDAGLAADLVESLAALVTEAWISDRNDGNFGLENPDLRATITLNPGAGGPSKQHVILVGSPTSGGAFAAFEGEDGVFILPKRVVATLDTLLLDRSVFVVDPAVSRRIVLELGGRRIVLEKQADSFVEKSEKPELSAARVQQIVEALSSMRAEAAIHLGAARPSEGLAKPELVVSAERPGVEGQKLPLRWRIGAADAWQSMSIYYARAEGVDATYVIARNKVKQVLDAL